jgi:hypothetical protein
MLRKQDSYFPDGLREGFASTVLSDPSGNLICNPVQCPLIHFFVNAPIRKNPNFPFKEREKEENPSVLLCLIKSFFKEDPLSPQPYCFLFGVYLLQPTIASACSFVEVMGTMIPSAPASRGPLR